MNDFINDFRPGGRALAGEAGGKIINDLEPGSAGEGGRRDKKQKNPKIFLNPKFPKFSNCYNNNNSRPLGRPFFIIIKNTN